jgi:maltose-binding protein MalE
MKRLIIAASAAIIGLSCTTTLQAQTSTQTTKSATKHAKKTTAAQKSSAQTSNVKRCDPIVDHNNAHCE